MIEVENVTKVYRMGDTELAALGGVSMSMADGEMVAVMGASGSGR